MNNLTKQQAMDALGLKWNKELAAMLGISSQAVGQWRDDAPLPEIQRLRLQYEIAPEAFGFRVVRIKPKKRRAH